MNIYFEVVIIPDTNKMTKEGYSMFDVSKYGDCVDIVFTLSY